MISRGKPREHQPARPLSNRAITLGAVIVLGIGAVAWTVLLWRYGGAEPGVELDAIRTAGAITAAAGGAAALLLAGRRQRSTELTLEHQREVAQTNERDAAEQRLTELYTRAVDQLGAEKAPVRLGGLHALERLAQNNPEQRQTIVDVICAYLRMPYTPPGDQAPGEDAPEDVHRRYEQRRQELQVRLTAQRILAAHLQPEAAGVYWADIDLNLSEAHLHQLDLTGCHVRLAFFDGAMFTGTAAFREVTFAHDAVFEGVKFAGDAVFEGVTFAGAATFGEATFTGLAVFNEATFASAWFGGATFTGPALFGQIPLSDLPPGYGGVTFVEEAVFDRATFAKGATFEGATFAEYVTFDSAKLTASPCLVVLPTGWTTRAARPAEGEEAGWLYVVRDEAFARAADRC